jgi:tRNA(Ile)-lysidine synthase TilS/MesJ
VVRPESNETLKGAKQPSVGLVRTFQLSPVGPLGTVVRPLLGCARAQILAYLRSQRQAFRTDETNFDTDIPRNAVRNLVLPLLEEKVHPGARAALWRLAEEAETQAERRAWRREWLAAFVGCGLRESISLPVPRTDALPAVDELSDVLDVLRMTWRLARASFTLRHAQALRQLFQPHLGPKRLDLPDEIVAERRRGAVTLYRKV